MSYSRTDHSPYFEMIGRILRAAGRRVAEGDSDDLAQLVALQDDLAAAVQTGVDGLRDSGVTWQGIADSLGCTRQNAIMRWGKRRIG